MEKKFEGRIGVVTGAAGGIGKATARRLAEEGCKVVLSDVTRDVVQSAEDIMRELPGAECAGVVTDVSDPVQVDALVAGAAERFGRLDIMFNNAGINQAMCEVAETTDAVFDRVINVNLRGVFNGCRAAMRQMIKQGGGGHIINTGSYYAKRGYGYFAVYCASKAAILNFTRSFAYEAIKHGVYVNAICPGNMYTQMHVASLEQEAEIEGKSFEEIREKYRKAIPVQRHGTGEDIASAVVFLCSDASAYTIGESLNVSGGLEML
jgi:NAD(P)-dependent dehydrogenase (short-subunit alcohol dehydrogenase family)